MLTFWFSLLMILGVLSFSAIVYILVLYARGMSK
jgi:hypothetical protein